jgi:hypothetical protein
MSETRLLRGDSIWHDETICRWDLIVLRYLVIDISVLMRHCCSLFLSPRQRSRPSLPPPPRTRIAIFGYAGGNNSHK